MADVIAADLGEILRREGKTAEAVSVLEEATQGKILGWGAWISLARIRSAAGDRAGATEAVRAALEAAPDEGWVQLVLAPELAAAGDRAGAIARLEDAERMGAATAESRESQGAAAARGRAPARGAGRRREARGRLPRPRRPEGSRGVDQDEDRAEPLRRLASQDARKRTGTNSTAIR